jgi:hypothetical protein
MENEVKDVNTLDKEIQLADYQIDIQKRILVDKFLNSFGDNIQTFLKKVENPPKYKIWWWRFKYYLFKKWYGFR